MGRITYNWKIFLALEVTTAKQASSKQDLLDRMSIILDEYSGSSRMKDSIISWYCISGWLATERRIEGGIYQYKADIAGRFSMNYMSMLPDSVYPVKYKYDHVSRNVKVEDSIHFTLDMDTTLTQCVRIEDFLRKKVPELGSDMTALIEGYGPIYHSTQDQLIWN